MGKGGEAAQPRGAYGLGEAAPALLVPRLGWEPLRARSCGTAGDRSRSSLGARLKPLGARPLPRHPPPPPPPLPQRLRLPPLAPEPAQKSPRGGTAAPGEGTPGSHRAHGQVRVTNEHLFGEGERKQMYIHIHSVTYVSSQKKAL